MNLIDILSTSPHYFYGKWIGATNENLILILGFKGLTSEGKDTELGQLV